MPHFVKSVEELKDTVLYIHCLFVIPWPSVAFNHIYTDDCSQSKFENRICDLEECRARYLWCVADYCNNFRYSPRVSEEIKVGTDMRWHVDCGGNFSSAEAFVASGGNLNNIESRFGGSTGGDETFIDRVTDYMVNYPLSWSSIFFTPYAFRDIRENVARRYLEEKKSKKDKVETSTWADMSSMRCIKKRQRQSSQKVQTTIVLKAPHWSTLPRRVYSGLTMFGRYLGKARGQLGLIVS